MGKNSPIAAFWCMLIVAMPVWGLDLNPGKYEITVSVEMQGIPAGMPGSMPARTMTKCLTEQKPLPNISFGDENCEIEDTQTEGNTVSFKMVCEQQGMESESSGEMTFKGDSLEGTTQTKLGPSAKGITVISKIAGRRIGECDKEDSPSEITTNDTSITMGEDNEGAETNDDSDSCAPARFRIYATHTFSWSPGRATDQFLVNGKTTMGAVCFVGTGTSEENPRQCRIPYSNNGYIQTDAGKCNVSGKSQALLEVVASCSKGNYVLGITEYQDPDAGLGGKMDCPKIPMTQPHPTYFPGTITEISFPTSQQSHVANDPGPDMSGSFEYAKSWEITAVSDAPCEDIKMLQLYLEAAQKRMELYEALLPQAKNAADLDRLVQEAMNKYHQDSIDSGRIGSAGPPTTAGHFDPCSAGGIHINSMCEGGQIAPPLCDWIDQGTEVHENRHRSDATSNPGDTWSYCKTQGKDQARIASEWEANAYGDEVEAYKEMLDALRDLFPECFK